MRSKALGLSSSSTKSNQSPKKSVDKENQNIRSTTRITEMTKKTTASPRKSAQNELIRVSNNTLTPSKARTVSSKNKEDADVGVVINITSNQNIQVRKQTKQYDE